ncbi:MAG: HNH endonuclease [Salinibacter sp.]
MTFGWGVAFFGFLGAGAYWIWRFVQRELEAEASASVSAPASPRRRGHIPSHVRRAVWQRDGGRCVRCGSTENIEFDHIVPVSKGGSSTTQNVELLCQRCNRSKSDKIE